MNRPTAAQHSWAQADTYARCQADGDSLRREHAANREPVKHLRVMADAPVPSQHYSENRVLAYFAVAVLVIFVAKHFWGIA